MRRGEQETLFDRLGEVLKLIPKYSHPTPELGGDGTVFLLYLRELCGLARLADAVVSSDICPSLVDLACRSTSSASIRIHALAALGALTKVATRFPPALLTTKVRS